MTVQHHHAHLAACLCDNGYISSEPVIGLSFDGTGYGSDGAIWGGEVLVGGYSGFSRRFHLAYTPLPGGDASVRRPARMALAHLWQAGIDWTPDLPPVAYLSEEERKVLKTQLERSLNAPLTSSMGRLFDAAASLMGIRHQVNYEGQAAIEMEALADPSENGIYPFDLQSDIIDPSPLWRALLADLHARLSPAVMAARFHNAIAALALELCLKIRAESGCQTVALSGGVWQNQFLLAKVLKDIHQAGFQALIHQQVPTNDGGIALGQLMVAVSSLQGSNNLWGSGN